MSILLSIDPGAATGYALIHVPSESVLDFGVLKQGTPDFSGRLRVLAATAEWLVIEDQYVGVNPHSALRVAKSKGLVLGILAGAFAPDRIREVNPKTWQAAYKLKGGRESCKSGAMVIARRAISGRMSGELLQDAADAVCMGLASARKIKADTITGKTFATTNTKG